MHCWLECSVVLRFFRMLTNEPPKPILRPLASAKAARMSCLDAVQVRLLFVMLLFFLCAECSMPRNVILIFIHCTVCKHYSPCVCSDFSDLTSDRLLLMQHAHEKLVQAQRYFMAAQVMRQADAHSGHLGAPPSSSNAASQSPMRAPHASPRAANGRSGNLHTDGSEATQWTSRTHEISLSAAAQSYMSTQNTSGLPRDSCLSRVLWLKDEVLLEMQASSPPLVHRCVGFSDC
jgi:hypothetical protein